MRVTFTVDGPPVPCARPRFNGHAFTPRTTQAYKARVLDAAARAVRAQHGPGVWAGDAKRYSVTMRFYKANARRADFDNLAKSVTDALSKFLYPDDAYIVRAYIEVEIDRENPRAEVEVESLDAPA